MSTDTAMQTRTAMIDANAFGRYTDLLGDLPRVARGEQERLGDLLDEIAAWVAEEESTCYHVAVYTGRVRGPLTFEAIKHTRRRRVGRVMRLLPETERRTRRLGTDDRVLVVEAAGRVAAYKRGAEDELRHRRERRCLLFERPE
jgi:AcrR family transcriptional regulator